MTSRVSGRRAARVMLACVLVGAVTACDGGETAQSEVKLSFDEGSLSALSSSGSTKVDVEVIAVPGGEIALVEGRSGGFALRFPALDVADPKPPAVLAVRPRSGDVPFPSNLDFEFGAEVMLDTVSEGSAVDNGNNVMQRGLFSDPSQFKIQIDHGKASCRVAGAAGEVTVKDEVPLAPNRWFRISCSRRGSNVNLTVTALDTDGAEPADRTREISGVGPTGPVEMDDPQSPLTIGGKVAENGQVAEGNSDQFNGAIDNVFFRTLN